MDKEVEGPRGAVSPADGKKRKAVPSKDEQEKTKKPRQEADVNACKKDDSTTRLS